MIHETSVLEAWDVDDGDFPHGASEEEKLRFALHYAVLAPSGHNTQPWLFQVDSDIVDVFADRTRALPVVDPHDRELTMSCGAALFHLRLALRALGLDTVVELLPDPSDPDLLARVRGYAEHRPSETESRMFEAIRARRTNRNPFEDRPLPEGLVPALQHDAAEEGAGLHLATDEEDKERLAELVAEGDRLQMADASFRRELAAWVHHNRSRTRDGMRGYSFGIGDLASLGGAAVIRTFDIGKGQAAKDLELATGSPILAVLHTPGDEAADWMAAGQALARVLLHATAEGVSASFLNQPVELAGLRTRLAAATCGGGRYPQALLRLGICRHELKAVPRRPVGEVLV